SSSSQVEEQPSPSTWLPSSHSSLPVSSPSPQNTLTTGLGPTLTVGSFWQVALQLSPLTVLPSSQPSPPSRSPLPHTASMQACPRVGQAAPGSSRQPALQPSPLTVLPSSQVSLP